MHISFMHNMSFFLSKEMPWHAVPSQWGITQLYFAISVLFGSRSNQWWSPPSTKLWHFAKLIGPIGHAGYQVPFFKSLISFCATFLWFGVYITSVFLILLSFNGNLSVFCSPASLQPYQSCNCCVKTLLMQNEHFLLLHIKNFPPQTTDWKGFVVRHLQEMQCYLSQMLANDCWVFGLQSRIWTFLLFFVSRRMVRREWWKKKQWTV